jgi:uncharacterized membrane-anchored protein YitT (DUF2179 family)
VAPTLRREGYSVTELTGEGDRGRAVEVLFVVEHRKHVPKLLRLIREVDPEAFWTISDIKKRPDDTTPGRRGVWQRPHWSTVWKKR